MAQTRTIDVQFPRGGLSKRFAYQQQPPYTTLDAANTRPEGVFEKRLRGGSRPGLVKSFSTPDSGNPIRMLTVMRTHNIEMRASFEEDFSASLATDWDAGAWQSDGLMPVVLERGKVGNGLYRGAILKNDTGEPGELLNTDAPYTLECHIDADNLESPSPLYEWDTVYIRLLARLDDTTPGAGSCVRAELNYFLTATHYYAELHLYVDGISRVSTRCLQPRETPLGPGVLRLTIDGNLSTASWNPDPGSRGSVTRVSTDRLTASSGKRVGIGAQVTRVPDGSVYFDDFVLRYIETGGDIPPEAVVAASKHDGANGKQGSNVWYETSDGVMVEVPCKRDTGAAGEETDLNHDVHIMAVDRLGKLYIADHGERQSASDGITNGTTFDDAADADWSEATGIGVDPHGDWLEILEAGTGATLGVYKITAAGSTTITVSSSMSTGAKTGVGYRIVRGPKVFDPAASSGSKLTRWEPTAGNIPLGCSIIEIFRDRAVFGGDPEHPGIYYMSRSGNFNDFYYGASVTDRARAVSDITTSSDGGQLSIPFSAIKAITEDYCLFSGESQLYLLRGDPTLGGIMGNVSYQIGIGSRTACCRIPDGSAVFLSRDGLYRFHPSQPFPENLSRDKLPLDLIDVVQNTDLTVTLEYDVRFQGVHIYVTPTTAGATAHYWFHWPAQGFCLVPLANTDHEPFAITYDAKANHVLLGCRDGYIRHYSAAASTDDGTAINSHVLYGPFSLGGNVREGAVNDIYVVLDDQSGDAVVEVFVGDDPESAYKSAAVISRTVSAGYSNRIPVRARGASAFVKISSSSGSQWAIDSLTLVTQRNGKHRG